MHDLKVETTDTFVVIGENGHKYQVLEITESISENGNGWVPTRKFLRTDGWDGVELMGEGLYRIPTLSVTARRISQ